MRKRRLKKLSDHELILHYRENGDKQAVGVLYERYAHLLLGIALKYLKSKSDAEDAVMHVFESLYDKLQSHEIQTFKTWVWSVMRNHCLMQLRKKQPQNVPVPDIAEPEGDHIQEKVELEKRIEKLHETIADLKPEQAQCVKLFFLEKQSYQQIAEHTGFSLKQVKSFIQNGKRNLMLKMNTP